MKRLAYFLLTSVLLLKLISAVCSSYASLTVSLNVTTQPLKTNGSFCAVYNPSFTKSLPTGNPPDRNQYHVAFYPNTSEIYNPMGCSLLPNDFTQNHSLVVDRGNCTYYRKALVAQKVNASLLVVVYNDTTVDSVPSLNPEDPDDPAITIPVLLVDNGSGEELKSWMDSSPVYLSAYIPTSPPVDPSSVVLFLIAVGTVAMASFLANTPFQFLRYGLLLRRGMEHFSTSREESKNKTLSVVLTVLGVIVMVTATCVLLLLLYFFYNPMVYIVLGLYCIASIFGLYNLLSPFVALIPLSDKCRLPPNKIPILCYRPNPLFFITVLFSVGVVIWWVVERHSVYAWILQDILGFAFIAMLLSRLKFLKAWVVAVLMILLFFYDIFMVFITPYFTNDGISVMEKAATGPDGSVHELLPVVFLVPKFNHLSTLDSLCSDYIKTRPASLLGYGDVGIPGLMVTLCLKFDLYFRRGKCFKIYYATSTIAYIVGLVATYVALAFMQTAQPALLYLVPTTLGSVAILSLIRREFMLFFTNKPQRSIKSESSVDNGDRSSATGQRSNNIEVEVESDVETDNENQHVAHNEKQALISEDSDHTSPHI